MKKTTHSVRYGRFTNGRKMRELEALVVSAKELYDVLEPYAFGFKPEIYRKFKALGKALK